MTAPLRIAFLGAARTVTGSRHRIAFGESSWLYDCGLYQGHRDEADAVNRTFQFDPATLDGVVVSHAHLDHTGNLPTLVAQGFGGPVHITDASADLARVMLPDSAFLPRIAEALVSPVRCRGSPLQWPIVICSSKTPGSFLATSMPGLWRENARYSA